MASHKKHPIPGTAPHQLARLYVAIYLGGYFGARILSIFIDEPPLSDPLDFLSRLVQLGPMTFYGGAIGGFLAGLFYAHQANLPIRSVADRALPAGFAALFFGRIGCFLNGDDFGKVVATSAEQAPWWAVTFPNLQDGLYRHPVQLYESAYALISTGVLFNVILPRYRDRPGSTALLTCVGYAIFRFFCEFFRGDPRGWIIEDVLTPSQGISLTVMAICGGWIIGLRHMRRNTLAA